MKNKYTGWKDVFRFTFIQSIKTKSIKISTLIICIIALISMPILSLIKGENGNNTTTIKKVNVVDNTGLNISIDDMSVLNNIKEMYNDIEYIKSDIDISTYNSDTKLKDIYKFNKNDTGIYMELQLVDNTIHVQLIYSKNSKVDKSDVEDYNKFLESEFRKVILKNQNLTNEQQIVANSIDRVEIAQNEENTTEEQSKKNHSDYGIMYGLTMIIMFILAFGGERIAMSIVTEKSSKVMEYLMTSIKPMALILGKLLASLLVLFVQAVCIGVSFMLSIVIAGYTVCSSNGKFVVPENAKGLINGNVFQNIKPIGIIPALLILVLGFLLFGLFAGLAGASVSKIEDVSEGVKLYTVLLIVGAYLSIFVVSGEYYEGTSIIKYIAVFFPLSTTFISPGALLTGNLSIGLGALCVVIMAVCVMLLTMFVANVYESMIYYNGSALKWKDIINISKQNRKTKGKEKME